LELIASLEVIKPAQLTAPSPGQSPRKSAAASSGRERPEQPDIPRLDFREADAPLAEKMEAVIANGKAENAWKAALAVCGEAVGPGGSVSKAKRLHKRFKTRERGRSGRPSRL
jgi:hypothetical protein